MFIQTCFIWTKRQFLTKMPIIKKLIASQLKWRMIAFLVEFASPWHDPYMLVLQKSYKLSFFCDFEWSLSSSKFLFVNAFRNIRARGYSPKWGVIVGTIALRSIPFKSNRWFEGLARSDGLNFFHFWTIPEHVCMSSDRYLIRLNAIVYSVTLIVVLPILFRTIRTRFLCRATLQKMNTSS